MTPPRPTRERPKVTVVLPTYNRADFIEQAVGSVLQQTTADWEVIVVDDGSTDGTKERLEPYLDRIEYVAASNGGPAHARNIGMRLARGEYIAFLDSDDEYYPYKLELQCRVMDRNPELGMVYTECSAFDADGFWDANHLRTYHESGYRDTGPGYDSMFETSVGLLESGVLAGIALPAEMYEGRRAYFGNIFDRYLLKTMVFTNSMMFRRSLLQDTGLQDESFTFFEELEFALRFCRHYKVGFLDVPTYKLRYHAGQMSTTTGPRGRYTAIRKQQYLLRAVKRHAFADRDYYRARCREIDACLAGLYRAVAVAMIAFDDGPGHARRSFPRRARPYLAACARLKRPERTLWFLSLWPSFVRRIAFAVSSRVTRRERWFGTKSTNPRRREALTSPQNACAR